MAVVRIDEPGGLDHASVQSMHLLPCQAQISRELIALRVQLSAKHEASMRSTESVEKLPVCLAPLSEYKGQAEKEVESKRSTTFFTYPVN